MMCMRIDDSTAMWWCAGSGWRGLDPAVDFLCLALPCGCIEERDGMGWDVASIT